MASQTPSGITQDAATARKTSGADPVRDYIEGVGEPDEIELAYVAQADAALIETVRISAEGGAGERLDRFLASRIRDVSRVRIQQWIALGAVWCDQRSLLAKTRLHGYEQLVVQRLPRDADSAFEPDPVPLTVVYEDSFLMVIDKPAGLVTHPAPGNWRHTLLNGLLFHRPEAGNLPRAGIVHRLDKDTSGLMVVGKTEAACAVLVAQLADRSMSRRYLAFVQGKLPTEGEIDLPIGRDPRQRTRMAVVSATAGRPAQTFFRRLGFADQPAGPVSLAGCTLRTGRTHQIRVHLSCRGYPLLGDGLYGGSERLIPRQALHACALALRHPEDGRQVSWRSDLPADLVELARSSGIGDGDGDLDSTSPSPKKSDLKPGQPASVLARLADRWLSETVPVGVRRDG